MEKGLCVDSVSRADHWMVACCLDYRMAYSQVVKDKDREGWKVVDYLLEGGSLLLWHRDECHWEPG
ncbi:hypothetical protein KDK_01300 [Dictyobacter kobayashii]|uniref:Uncharacterized protein n=1 Tax=Dictyobacter kobayashii TaxID=2014872 RepID=A0A402AB35_9CHLR|nr:hypothetical protein KDK_01300 [Dictyobacter kobayashii]